MCFFLSFLPLRSQQNSGVGGGGNDKGQRGEVGKAAQFGTRTGKKARKKKEKILLFPFLVVFGPAAVDPAGPALPQTYASMLTAMLARESKNGTLGNLTRGRKTEKESKTSVPNAPPQNSANRFSWHHIKAIVLFSPTTTAVFSDEPPSGRKGVFFFFLVFCFFVLFFARRKCWCCLRSLRVRCRTASSTALMALRGTLCSG